MGGRNDGMERGIYRDGGGCHCGQIARCDFNFCDMARPVLAQETWLRYRRGRLRALSLIGRHDVYWSTSEGSCDCNQKSYWIFSLFHWFHV